MFNLGLLAVAGVGVGSLYTPYPAQLLKELKAFHAEPEATAQAVTPQESVIEPPPQQQPEPLPVASSIQTTPWQPSSSFRMAEIHLPPFPPALPERVEIGKFEHINEMERGINIKSHVNFSKGTTASQDRKKKQAYQVNVSLELLTPQAAQGNDLLQANPKLNKVLNSFDDLMKDAKISPWYHKLYQYKQNRIRHNASTLSRLLDRHNYYDTDSILEITGSGNNRKALWIQADMDVVSDGSDGDRLPDMPKKIKDSEFYQPSTSYKWRKKTKTPNPLLASWQERLQKYKEAKNQDGIKRAERIIGDLKLFSFLLAEYDSFIVVPLTVNDKGTTTKQENHLKGFRPAAGDYAVVIVDNKVYPAIVGDFGPKFKTGEASLRLCKTINSKAGVNSRPVSNLGVSYIIFPGTKEPENGPIDYDRLNTKCRELINELGGLGKDAEFVEMKDLLPQPKPQPAKPETPAPAPAPPAETTPAPAADSTAAQEQQPTQAPQQ
ncbi:MAG: glycoside hydrolase family 75 protein [Akkermansia sp.]|nr:glycoside hydrolase family 75 protein [Akkermansia sp.]